MKKLFAALTVCTCGLSTIASAEEGAWMVFVHAQKNAQDVYEGMMLGTVHDTEAECLVAVGRVQMVANKSTFINCVFLPFNAGSAAQGTGN